MEFVFTDDQQLAVNTFAEFLTSDEKYMTIQGSAGCGKTTLIKHLIELAYKMQDLISLVTQQDGENIEIELTATTNPAAAVLTNLSGQVACTIHTLLGLKVTNDIRTGKTNLIHKRGHQPVTNKLIIIDEASMVNDDLFSYINELTPKCKVVLIGDQYQLTPVNQATTVLETLTCPKVVLNKIMRNSGLIARIGAQFRQTVETGIFSMIQPDDDAIERVDGPTFKRRIDEAYRDCEDPNNMRVLAWTNKRVIKYNTYIRELRGLPAALQVGERVFTNKPIISGSLYLPADSSVLITKTGKKHTNQAGILGRYVEINNACSLFLPNFHEAEGIYLKKLAKVKNWKEYFKVKESWADIRPSYACTVHKAQGSSYDEVFIDLPDIGKCHIGSDVARMLYVAISRSRYKVTLYGALPTRYTGVPDKYYSQLQEVIK